MVVSVSSRQFAQSINSRLPRGLLCFVILLSFFQAVSSQSSACGLANYYACPATFGGGCCPLGFTCLEDSCLPPDHSSVISVSSLESDCPSYDGFATCARSNGGGCCAPGYSCDPQTTTLCLLTLKLIETTFTTTYSIAGTGSLFVQTYVSIIGPTNTAVVRVSMPTERSLSPSQIGGIAGGVVGGVLLVAAAGAVVMFRKRRERERGVADTDEAHGKPEMEGEGLPRKELGGDDGVELEVIIDPVELPVSLAKHELTGSYEAHGVSELDGTSEYAGARRGDSRTD